MANEKVIYGLKNVHYAVLSEDTTGKITYGSPIRMLGAVNLGLSQEGELVEFYADDVVYYSTVVNNGYSGDVEIAAIQDTFKVDVLGEITDANGVQFEVANTKPKRVALLAEFDTDQVAKRICLYNVMCKRPDIASKTKESSVDVSAQKLSITARPIEIEGKLIVKSSTTSTTNKEKYETWFTAVPMFKEITTTP